MSKSLVESCNVTRKLLVDVMLIAFRKTIKFCVDSIRSLEFGNFKSHHFESTPASKDTLKHRWGLFIKCVKAFTSLCYTKMIQLSFKSFQKSFLVV